MDKYRQSQRREEILKVLSGQLQGNQIVSVWQKDTNGVRVFLSKGNLLSVDEYEGEFIIALIEIPTLNDFNSDHETFFLFEEQEFAFKARPKKGLTKEKNHLRFTVPKEMRLREMRAHPRTNYSLEEKRNAEVVFQSRHGERKICAICPVINISEGGVCIIISKETLSDVDLKDEIIIRGLTFFDKLYNEKLAKVRNARSYTKISLNSDETYAIGLQFS